MEGESKKTPQEMLSTPVQFLKGVGPKKAELLNNLGLKTAKDILFFFPRDYQEVGDLRSIQELEENIPVSVCVTVEEADLRNSESGKAVLGVLFKQEKDFLRGLWFNRPNMREKFSPGQRVLLSGKAQKRGLRWQMIHPEIQWLDAEGNVPSGKIMPIYPLTSGINQSRMRRIVENVVTAFVPLLDEVFPDDYLKRQTLWSLNLALPQIHNPTSLESLERARHRFVYQELLVLQLALAVRRQKIIQSCKSIKLELTPKIDTRIRQILPFELTSGQNRAVEEVVSDLACDMPMNRLLQGEVGSGKTLVAVYAMLLTVAHRQQAVLMAPSEVLAQQHLRTLRELLKKSRVRIELLTGSLTASQRERTLKDLGEGKIDIVVGTQAIVHACDSLKNIGLIVIDEQHKFGVRQRAKLRDSGLAPHYLVMSATPIPRTISMILFGDLDSTTIKGSPPGRQKVNTYLGDSRQREKWWSFFRKKLRQGRQGFVITPIVDSSEKMDVLSLQQAFEELANGELEAFRLDLLHGRMSSAEKDSVMESFRKGETQVLVATSIVEIGIDIPNATIMTIESAERFGLSQLHQLRGRVSRGSYPGFVCAFPDSSSLESRERLKAFAEISDGFELAEKDFQIRGPGDLFGSQQHGLPPLLIADLRRDSDVLHQARSDALALVSTDQGLENPDYAPLKRMVFGRYGRSLEISDVG